MKNGMKRKENTYYQLPIDQDVVPENVTPSIPHEHMKIGDSILLHPDQLKITMSRIIAIVRGWAYDSVKEVVKYWGYRREEGGVRVWRLPPSEYHVPIEKDIPVPDDATRLKSIEMWPHEDMQIGESVWLPEGHGGLTVIQLTKLAGNVTKKYKGKRRFIFRKMKNEEGVWGVRIWRSKLEVEGPEPVEIEMNIPFPPGEE
jgi:hypothetical protein